MLRARTRKAKVGDWRLGKGDTSKEVDVGKLKMPSDEDCASELQAGPTVEPSVQSSP
jgi:hypothetical protein